MDQQGTRKQENLKQPVVTKQQALRMLETYFGYTSFRPAQEAPIASLLRHEDVPAQCRRGLVSLSVFRYLHSANRGLLSYFHHLFLL